MQITISVPIPKSDQNKMMHHRAKALARQEDWKNAKEAAEVAVRDLGNWKEYKFPWKSAEMHVRWYHPTRRHRDSWNIVGCLKGTLDGIVRAGILVDDNEVQPPTVERLTDNNNPRVEIVLSSIYTTQDEPGT